MTEATLTPDLVQFIRDQKDRQEIWDCLLRYTRGVDRHDKGRKGVSGDAARVPLQVI